jgi:hypothetical protein
VTQSKKPHNFWMIFQLYINFLKMMKNKKMHEASTWKYGMKRKMIWSICEIRLKPGIELCHNLNVTGANSETLRSTNPIRQSTRGQTLLSQSLCHACAYVYQYMLRTRQTHAKRRKSISKDQNMAWRWTSSSSTCSSWIVQGIKNNFLRNHN